MPRKPLAVRTAQAFGEWPATADDTEHATAPTPALPPSITWHIDTALEVIADPRAPAETRGALYAILYQLQRNVRRSLGIGIRSGATPQAELLAHMERNGLQRMGPLSVRATPFDVTWPVNHPDNWADYGLQDELAQFAKMAPDYIRRVPEHYELDTAALGEGIGANDPVAVKLHRHASASGWRREGGRRLSLAVTDRPAA
jgi:hypothetical protein